jgi:hypothetical protein
LYIRISTSAPSIGQMRMSPSPPTPKWRSEIARAKGAISFGGALAKQST